ncbi:MAG TPA: hypothetical protein VD967_01755 [Candidatus Paceibacterota bacterium]|nr:hypothetical protein [Candidatus Paceibacterota bacterium]
MTATPRPKILLIDKSKEVLTAWARALSIYDMVCEQKAFNGFFHGFVPYSSFLRVIVLPRYAQDGCTLEFVRKIRERTDFKGVIFATSDDKELRELLDETRGECVVENPSHVPLFVLPALARFSERVLVPA